MLQEWLHGFTCLQISVHYSGSDKALGDKQCVPSHGNYKHGALRSLCDSPQGAFSWTIAQYWALHLDSETASAPCGCRSSMILGRKRWISLKLECEDLSIVHNVRLVLVADRF